MEQTTNPIIDGDPVSDAEPVSIALTGNTSGLGMDMQAIAAAESVVPDITALITNTPQPLPPKQSQNKAHSTRSRLSLGEPTKSALLADSATTASAISTNVERRPSKYRCSISGSQRLQETLKEKQIRYREERENRKIKIDSLYKYIFDILACRLDLEHATVEELLLDAPSFQDFDDFFIIGGRRSLMFFYQEADVPGIECGRTILGAAKGAKMMRLFLGNIDETFKGLCLFLIRCTNDKLITAKNIHEEIHFSVLDATEGVFAGIGDLLAKIFLPAIDATDNWGPLNQSINGDSEKQRFKENIVRTLSILAAAKVSIDKAVRLNKMESIDFSKLQSFEGMMAAASNPEMLAKCEAALMVWYKQIQQVLIQSEQMRKEADYAGPLTELEHWKGMSVKFNFIIEQIKAQNCKAVITVLNIARSKVLKMWKELDARITDAANESKDNVKFLYTLEKVCQPLYSFDLVSMAQGIQNLINTIGMIYSISRYYNTSEQITSLFIKVTNQMVTQCKACITERGKLSVWQQDESTVMNKIQECILLFKEYQRCFHKTQQHYKETQKEKAFEVSEMYIFGKLEAFCKRIEKIAEMVSVVQTYSALSKSTIEGIGALYTQFKNIHQSIIKKTYDNLDLRKTEFDVDYTEFMAKINGLETQIRAFMSNCFDRILSPQQAVQLLQRFQKLNMPCLQSEITLAFRYDFHVDQIPGFRN